MKGTTMLLEKKDVLSKYQSLKKKILQNRDYL